MEKLPVRAQLYPRKQTDVIQAPDLSLVRRLFVLRISRVQGKNFVSGSDQEF